MKPKITMQQLPAAARPETKYADFLLAPTTASSAILNLRMFQGDDGDDFIGSQVHLKSLDMSVGLDNGAATDQNYCRVSILIPKDPTVVPVALGPTQRYDHRSFTILYDEFFTTQEKNGTRIKLNLGMIQRYNVLGTNVTQNNLYFAVNTFSTVGTIDCAARLYYTDA